MEPFKIRQTVDLNSSGPQEIKQAHGHVGDKLAHQYVAVKIPWKLTSTINGGGTNG